MTLRLKSVCDRVDDMGMNDFTRKRMKAGAVESRSSIEYLVNVMCLSMSSNKKVI